VGKTPLVGREEPVRWLTRAVDEALAGIGRFVLIAGEPGVGKTRLALEVLDIADRRGARTAAGACWDGAGAPALWPWMQVVRALRVSLGHVGWERVTESGHDALTRLLDADQRPSGDFHLFEAVLQLFADLCVEQPLVVVLDDLQWADQASLSLLDFLHRHAVHLPALMVGTYREDEVARLDRPQHVAIAELAQKAFTIPLAGLDNDGIRRLRYDLGVSTSTAEAEHLRRLTGGNPFFVIESVAYSDPLESLGVRRGVARRVAALGDLERRVLQLASVIGPEVPDALVGAVVGDGSDEALRRIESATLMRREDAQHMFVHDLVRESIRDSLSPDERRFLCARVVQAATTPELGACLLPAQVASLAIQAIPDIASERAVETLEAAAQDASARLTHEAAGRYFEQAAALTDDPGEWARLSLQSGHSYQRGGALDLARERYRGLLEVADVSVRVHALLGLHQLGDPAAVGEPSDLVRRLDEVDAELRGTDELALRAEVLAARSRSRAHLLADDRSSGVPMAAEALELARGAGAERTVVSCLLAYHDAIWGPGTEDERRDLAGELATVGRRIADPALEAQGLLLRLVAEIENADPRYLATHAQFDAVAEASQLPRLRFVAASRRGTIAALRGELPTALVEMDAARTLGERIGEPDALGMWCDQRWQVAHHAGDQDTIDELVSTLRNMGDPHWMVYEAVVAADLGDVRSARQLGPEIALLCQRWPRWAARLWNVLEVKLAILDHDIARIADLVERLQADADHWAVLGGAVLVHGPVSLWLSRLEAERGDYDQALSWAARAEAAAQRLGAQPWLLEARVDRLVLQHAAGTADKDEVVSTTAAARQRGLVPIVERLRALTPIPPGRPANVFRRDHDIWTLVFDGVEARLPNTKGLCDLHTLLANPRIEVPATSLVTGAILSADAAPVLDVRAKAEYRRRLDDLDRELDRAGRHGDAEREETLERERQALLGELRRAAGLGGRDRGLNDQRERLRKAVTARIRDTMRRLDDRHPPLAAHLRAYVRTGTVCVYAPAEPVSWDLGPRGAVVVGER
jgi:hypothetical protein